jgi:undecaprenyl diphosphate synthase
MKRSVQNNNLPEHIAVIMDGNGRWARQKGARRIFGHRNAIQAVRETTEAAAELGIKYLTLFAFSTENWDRPRQEVEGLMELLVTTIRKEKDTLTKNDVRLSVIGDTDSLPAGCQQALRETMDITRDNGGLNLVLALSYSGRWDILQATRHLLKDVKNGVLDMDKISSDVFSGYLCTSDIPDPELLIRTSGEMRISNFLLWQLAYTELYVTEVLWPDFRKEHLLMAIEEYQKRERRFGKVIESENM